jgi:membrane protease YdiL (CAAX protease family)
MTASSLTPAQHGDATRFTRFSIVRILLALLAVCIPVALTLILVHQIPDKSMRWVWPTLLAAALGTAGYLLYVRRVEQRRAVELAGPAATRELGKGLALGTGLLVLIVGVLAASGSYRVTGLGSLSVLISPFAEMVMVALLEEILFRGVLFRITERSLGSWAAFIISSVLFAAAHLPNENITVLAVGNTFAAGLMFAAAYMATRRLWLAIGIHFAWNFLSVAVFSVPNSGNPAKGLLNVQIAGPEWLTGGAYGVEASAVTLVVLLAATVWLLQAAIRRGQVTAFRGKGQQL